MIFLRREGEMYRVVMVLNKRVVASTPLPESRTDALKRAQTWKEETGLPIQK